MKALLVVLASFLVYLSAIAQEVNVLEKIKISHTQGSLGQSLVNNGLFGAVANINDLNQDGITDLIVGAPGRSDGGAAYILFLNESGTVSNSTQLGLVTGGFNGDIAFGDQFGKSLTPIGDIDGDGIMDVAIGAPGKATGTLFNSGAVWIVFLNQDGTVKDQIKIAHGINGFAAQLDEEDYFGTSVAAIGDLNDDGISELAVGAPGDDDGGANHGAFYVLFLNELGNIINQQKVSSSVGGFNEYLETGDNFGYVSAIGDLNQDGIIDVAVGTPGDDDGGIDFGAFYLCLMNSNGTVQSQQKISAFEGGFEGMLNTGDQFGISATSMGDIDGDGIIDIVVGAPGDDDGNIDTGACWVLLLNSNLTVKQDYKISRLEGQFGAGIGFGDRFGESICNLGDFNQDGTVDFVAGVPSNDDGGNNRGAIYLTLLNACQAPSANFTYNQNGNIITFIPEETGAEDYFWFFDDGWISYEMSPEHAFDGNGNYQVCLTTSTQCGSNNSCLMITIFTTNAEDNEKQAVSVFPVPSRNYISVSGANFNNNNVITATSANGTSIILKQQNGKIDISALSAGIYAASITGSTEILHFKFIKE
jgi:hypothetical protein